EPHRMTGLRLIPCDSPSQLMNPGDGDVFLGTGGFLTSGGTRQETAGERDRKRGDAHASYRSSFARSGREMPHRSLAIAWEVEGTQVKVIWIMRIGQSSERRARTRGIACTQYQGVRPWTSRCHGRFLVKRWTHQGVRRAIAASRRGPRLCQQ